MGLEPMETSVSNEICMVSELDPLISCPDQADHYGVCT